MSNVVGTNTSNIEKKYAQFIFKYTHFSSLCFPACVRLMRAIFAD